jgi:hypothetical protein
MLEKLLIEDQIIFQAYVYENVSKAVEIKEFVYVYSNGHRHVGRTDLNKKRLC